MTAPRPRVEGEAVKWLLIPAEHATEMEREPRKYGAAWKHEAIAQSAANARLTAEVERLRGVMESVARSTDEIIFYHEQRLVSEAADRFRQRVRDPLRAALPTPAPEAKE